VGKDFLLRVPLERDTDELGQVTAFPELTDELTDMNFGPTVDERNLSLANEDRAHTHA
jgi:hypothetical protein